MSINLSIKKPNSSEVDPSTFTSIQNLIRKKIYTTPRLIPLLHPEIAGGDQTHVVEASGGFLSAS